MKKLGQLALCGIDFTVYSGNAEENANLEDNQGYCNNIKEQIWLRDSLSPTGFFDTLVHEMLHALLTNSGTSQFLKGCIPAGADQTEIEETIVRILTPHLANAILQLHQIKKK